MARRTGPRAAGRGAVARGALSIGPRALRLSAMLIRGGLPPRYDRPECAGR